MDNILSQSIETLERFLEENNRRLQELEARALQRQQAQQLEWEQFLLVLDEMRFLQEEVARNCLELFKDQFRRWPRLI